MKREELNKISEETLNKSFYNNLDFIERLWDEAFALAKDEEAKSDQIKNGKRDLTPLVSGIFIKAVKAGAYVGMHATLTALEDLEIIKLEE